MKTIAGIIASLLFTSCVTQREITSLEQIEQISTGLPRDKATVFVHIPPQTEVLSGTVTLDGQAVAKLPKGSFTRLTLKPGRRVLDIKYPAITGPTCDDFSGNFKADTVYHVAFIKEPKPGSSFGAHMMHELVYNVGYLKQLHPMDGIQLSRFEKYVQASQ
jgi:hypothetical protein